MESLSEEGRGFRQRKKQTDPICCPVCGVTIRPSEIEQHYALEIDRLIKLQLNPKIKKTLNNGSTYHDPLPGCSSSNGNQNDESSGCPWITFQKVRNNRHSRLKIKAKKRKPDEPVCPICNEHPTEDINIHVEKCLRKNESANRSSNGGAIHNTSDDDDDESIDVEGESFEEYEWAGQKRIRASSLLEGGYSAVGIGTSINNNNSSNNSNNSNGGDDDEEEDLNVDGDDSQIYGPPQYTERDVIVPLNNECGNENNSDQYLRRLVSGQDITTTLANNVISNDISTTTTTNTINQINSNNIESIINTGINHNKINDNINHRTIDGNLTIMSSNNNHVIESLKSRIREYENQINNKIKCLICMDDYRNPAVSICCWHVHCEECWLRTLGARKLCPQCNMITSPTDLRRIYM